MNACSSWCGWCGACASADERDPSDALEDYLARLIARVSQLEAQGQSAVNERAELACLVARKGQEPGQ